MAKTKAKAKAAKAVVDPAVVDAAEETLAEHLVPVAVAEQVADLVGQVQRLVDEKAARAPLIMDAIDRELGRPRRKTAARSLADAPEMVAFRDEVANGLIRVDTVNQVLRLVNQFMPLLLGLK